MFGFRPDTDELFFVEAFDLSGRLLCITPLCDGILIRSVEKSHLHSAVQGLGISVEEKQNVNPWVERLASMFTTQFPLRLHLVKTQWNWLERKLPVTELKGESLYEVSLPLRN